MNGKKNTCGSINKTDLFQIEYSRPYGRIVIATNGREKIEGLRPDCLKKINNDSKMGKMRNE